MIDMVFGAPTPGRTPSAAPATPNAVAFKNCRRELSGKACTALVIAILPMAPPVHRQERSQTFFDPTFRPVTYRGGLLPLSLALPYTDATGFSQAYKLRGLVQRDNWMKSP
jgi:hypothetical protein